MNLPQEYKRVFILGSGFSKSFSKNIPSLYDLTQDIFNSNIDIGSELYNLILQMKNIQDRTNTICSIENLTTIIFSKRIYIDFSEEEKYYRLRQQILEFIYNKIKGYKVDDVSIDTLKKFLRACFLEHASSYSELGKNLFISFNYDLLLENFLNELPQVSPFFYHFDYGIDFNEYSINSSQTNKRKTRPFQYIKLHGSFNWFKAKGSTDYNIHSIYRVDPGDPNIFIHKDDIPVFIPMAHAKDSFLYGTLYNTLWVKATYYLKNADEIYFIGYGFPNTDINNLLYFLQFKDKIKNIVVYYKDVKNNLNNKKQFQRLKDIFGNDTVLNIDAKEYISNNLHDFCHIKDFYE